MTDPTKILGQYVNLSNDIEEIKYINDRNVEYYEFRKKNLHKRSLTRSEFGRFTVYVLKLRAINDEIKFLELQIYENAKFIGKVVSMPIKGLEYDGELISHAVTSLEYSVNPDTNWRERLISRRPCWYDGGDCCWMSTAFNSNNKINEHNNNKMNISDKKLRQMVSESVNIELRRLHEERQFSKRINEEVTGQGVADAVSSVDKAIMALGGNTGMLSYEQKQKIAMKAQEMLTRLDAASEREIINRAEYAEEYREKAKKLFKSGKPIQAICCMLISQWNTEDATSGVKFPLMAINRKIRNSVGNAGQTLYNSANNSFKNNASRIYNDFKDDVRQSNSFSELGQNMKGTAWDYFKRLILGDEIDKRKKPVVKQIIKKPAVQEKINNIQDDKVPQAVEEVKEVIQQSTGDVIILEREILQTLDKYQMMQLKNGGYMNENRKRAKKH